MAARSPLPSRKRVAKPRSASRSTRSTNRSLFRLLDDTIDDYTVSDWRDRNLRLVEELIDLGYFDPDLVSREAHRQLTESLIQVLNAAATDPQNAGHVRAQNENILHFGVAAGVSKKTLTIALEAGFIHDLNKAVGEPLRQDEYGVRDARGRLVPVMTTMAQIVGLNHLGDRTRAVIAGATRLAKGAIALEHARAIDQTIVHHGLGSSRFIQELVVGKNPWWGDEFVDPETKKKKLVHPAQPALTMESVIHNLADSAQQMQGGAAWLMKYPAGFWRGSGRSLADMLSGGDADVDAAIPMSLRLQIEVESATCGAIIGAAEDEGIIDLEVSKRLVLAVDDAIESSRRWLDNSPSYLADQNGVSAYHDVGRSLGISAEAAHERLKSAISGTREADELEPILWESGRHVDLERARALAHRLCA